ncbi:PHP domain-containing protein [Halorhabdus rudnickae]|uniref:PHP domain-containing protein n=1 Tax=Halorhabdus rudnickae TaxID=1775544 RepID=UPI0010845F60|nr:PHP domain-containing protein [Halorhabdus rudnickae]
MVVADLHVHTTRSDGSLAPERVANAARRAGLEAVAITDHDRLPPDEVALTDQDGVTVIGGIELRVTTDEEPLDLLGYGIDPTPAIRAEIDRLQRDRIERARTIVSRVEDHIDVDLDISFGPGVGRPHVARAIARSPASYGYDEAFEHLIGDDGPCYVARDITSYERGRELLAEACDLVSLAHPLRYDDPGAALSRVAELDAVELAYPYGRAVDLAPVEAAIGDNDLLATGGSDAHGQDVGIAGLDQPAYGRVRDRLTG